MTPTLFGSPHEMKDISPVLTDKCSLLKGTRIKMVKGMSTEAGVLSEVCSLFLFKADLPG